MLFPPCLAKRFIFSKFVWLMMPILILYKKTKFRFIHAESNCRWKVKGNLYVENSLSEKRKQFAKGRNCCIFIVLQIRILNLILINSIPNDKIWGQSNLKAFADDILNAVQMMICVTDWVENIVGKGENAGYQHFLLFPHSFWKASFQGSLKVWILW